MSNYIEFVHDHSDASIANTFEDMSTNDRVVKFEVITNTFPYDGWYTYYRYEDDTKSNLIENGKLFLDDPKTEVVYNKPNNEKIIYKR